MPTHYPLSDLDYIYFWDGDSITNEFSPLITKKNADYLHGINFSSVFLRPRSYNSTVLKFINRVLEPNEKFDYRTACEVNTRIYVRNDQGKWKAVPKRQFWKDQCKCLWNVWKVFVNFARPTPKDRSDVLEVARLQWSDRLMHQIDAKRSDGEFKYNPLLSVKSRRRLREIYEKHVFNRELYDKEKGRPGRPKKKQSPPTKARLIQSVSDQTPSRTNDEQSTSRVLTV